MSDVSVKDVPGGVTFPVRVTPRAHKNEIAGVQGEALKIKLAAPPVKGAANSALCDFLAEQLGVRKSAVTLVAGRAGRNKVVRIQGATADHVRTVLGKALGLREG